jgi:hypothetical protein
MKISGHRTRSVFDRYNISSEEDLRAAADRLDRYIQQKKVTIPVTQEQTGAGTSVDVATEGVEIDGGEGGIRTHGPLRDNGFRDLPEQRQSGDPSVEHSDETSR